MKIIETEFKKLGFSFRQVFREGMWAIYEKTLLEPLTPVGVELVKIQECRERQIQGVVIPEREAMPGNEMWGTNGFTLPTVDAAREKLRGILAKQAARAAAESGQTAFLPVSA